MVMSFIIGIIILVLLVIIMLSLPVFAFGLKDSLFIDVLFIFIVVLGIFGDLCVIGVIKF